MAVRPLLKRRDLIQSAFGALGTLGLSAALGSGNAAQAAALGHYAGQRTSGKAKRVISLFLQGGPSQVDLFDPKPLLVKFQGQRPGSVDLRTERQTGGLMPSPFQFAKHGRGGVDVSEMLPKLAGVIDEICVIRSIYSFNPTHTPSVNLYHTGTILPNRPSIGSWVSYGLGSENQNLPSFIALSSGGSATRSGFLPAAHQGTPVNHTEVDPEKMIPNLRNKELDPAAQRKQLDAIQALNKEFGASFGADDYLDGRIQSMEAAYRMQFEAMDVFDIRKESAATRALYGETPFGNGCLLARRLVEKGVRYVNVGSGDWDDHKDIETAYRKKLPAMDQAAAALIADLKQRGMLDDTIVIWGGEFGRTPVSESGTGRDHNPYGFTMWVAGGGFKGGLAYGATDDFGFKAVENRVSIHDFHATVLHALGIEHMQLTYRYAGRDFRLTDVFGNAVKDILA
ncbi:MAG: DUF1501 domain-containing protein [Acidobacteria bacterium]|nr:DUF1501 domain-containing protein [Acidobacteriota bacterium]